jgi:hypothetical protein
MFLRISSKRWRGSLEGTNRLGLDVLPHAGFQRPFLDQFDRAAQHPREMALDSHDIEQRDTAGVIERRQ